MFSEIRFSDRKICQHLKGLAETFSSVIQGLLSFGWSFGLSGFKGKQRRLLKWFSLFGYSHN